nr:expressed protein [Hymenolepis microstoma]
MANMASVLPACSLSIHQYHRVVINVVICTHPQLKFVCVAACNPAICVNGLSTDRVLPVRLLETVGEWGRGYGPRDVFTRLISPV